jgi:hypothetical protein
MRMKLCLPRTGVILAVGTDFALGVEDYSNNGLLHLTLIELRNELRFVTFIHFI